MTKVATPVIQTLLDDALIDFGTSHVTINYDTKQWMLTATYTTMGDSFTDCELYLGDNKMNLTPEQLDLIYLFLKKKIEDEQYSEAEHKRRSMDCDNGSHLIY
jgi:hypothetical protein